ncbi:Calcium channel YVC1 [Paramyrothecium foliicola]|nr:Calcium channel YVC1 [Paramyrothecium foliicola]
MKLALLAPVTSTSSHRISSRDSTAPILVNLASTDRCDFFPLPKVGTATTIAIVTTRCLEDITIAMAAGSRWSASSASAGIPMMVETALAEVAETGFTRRSDLSMQSAIPAEEVTKVCLRLRHLIQECIPCELDEARITTPHSKVITPQVIQAAKEAGGSDNKGCVAYSLLVNMRWFRHEALVELWDADLHKLRSVACGVIAKAILVSSIEGEEDKEYLTHHVLLRRYSHLTDGVQTAPVNVIEKAVDLHAVRVIGSSGYQKCISHLWRGWLVQDEDDPSQFVEFKDKDNTNFLVHMDPDRMRAPMYQNAAQMLFSIIFLILYTMAINSVNPSGVFDGAEIALYVFTLGFICDELLKFYKAGYHILGFWNAFNGLLYIFLVVSFALRVVGLVHESHDHEKNHWRKLSYNFLAFVAPMFWGRLLLYLDSFRFFGAMLVVLKVMMKESVIFFALLIIIVVGFLQAFIGLDLTDDNVAGDALFIIESMLKALLGSPEFEGFEMFGPPFGIILYYCFTFVIMIILLNILIALYNSAYEDIYDNADDEYLALFSQKTLQFVRAPDENVYIAPLNLIEMVVVALTEWWMDKHRFEVLNDWVMGVLYSPLLFVAAFFEVRTAHDIRSNRARGEEDDDVVEEWEQMEHMVDFEADGWAKTCQAVKPNVEDDAAVLEIRQLRDEVAELKSLLLNMSEAFHEQRKGVTAPEQTEDAEATQVDQTEDNEDGEARAGNLRDSIVVCHHILVQKRHKHHPREGTVVLLQEGPHRLASYLRRLPARVAIDAGADAAKGDGLDTARDGQLQALLVAAAEQGLAGALVLEDGADGVDDVLGGQAVAAGDAGLAGGTAAELRALGAQAAARGEVDGAVDAAAAEEGAVGGVDDGVDLEGGDVAAEEADAVVDGFGGGVF